MQLFDGMSLRFVRGTFDPLLAAHAQELVDAVQPDVKLVVIVDPGVDPILPVRARAELVAGVRAVDYVLPLEPGEGFEASSTVDLVAAHNARLAGLIDHVKRRA